MNASPNPAPKVDFSRVHLVGIGGAGMSGVAHILLARGAKVSGSDVKDSRPLMALRASGAKIAVGHAAENLMLTGELPTVVVTSFAAIPKDNPELMAAAEHGIPVVRRSDLLAWLMEGSIQVLIAGTHGKTSTTSLCTVALQAAGMDPSFAIGGQLNKAGTNAHWGTGDCFVAEADESDASLLRYSPNIAVITNIEPDHLDFFHTAEAYTQVFTDFANLVPSDGHLVVCLDDEPAAQLGQALAGKVNVAGYGTREAAKRYPELAYTVLDQVSVDANLTTAQISVGRGAGTDSEGLEQVELRLQIPGVHMALNAAAALTAGVLAGGDINKLISGINDFTGVRRRFEHIGTVDAGPLQGVEVYDDYAHHPTEVQGVLRAARQRQQARENGRVIVAFQPHLYSRTMEFAQGFADALSLADEAVVLDIYGAREKPVEGVNSTIITEKMTIPASFEPDFSAVPVRIAEIAQPGDLILTVGAGSVTMLAPEIVAALREQG